LIQNSRHRCSRPELYDEIGIDYAHLRRADPRIAQQITQALGTAETVLNVGAGTGSYEPRDKKITAVEPSAAMIAQRAEADVTLVQGRAEDLPFADKSFDASMAVLTLHHWTDQRQGIAEMRRVTRGKIVIVTFDPDAKWFWLADYFPALATLDKRQMPRMIDLEAWLGAVTISDLPIPCDCRDGFLAGYWRRPAAYLDQRVRAAMSSFGAIGGVSFGLQRLGSDLTSGLWHARYAVLFHLV